MIFGGRAARCSPRRSRASPTAPGKYHEDRVYGEHEAGGTQVLYLSHVPFEKLGPAHAVRPRRSRPAPATSAGPSASSSRCRSCSTRVFLRFFRRNWKVHEEEVARLKAERGLEEQL